MADAISTTSVTPTAVPARMSAPEYLDWHMILDQELSQLSKPETGIIGSIGFLGLGAALGLAPGALTAWDKVTAQPAIALTSSDLASTAICLASFAVSVVCLVIFGLSVWRNRGLAEQIRSRARRDL